MGLAAVVSSQRSIPLALLTLLIATSSCLPSSLGVSASAAPKDGLEATRFAAGSASDSALPNASQQGPYRALGQLVGAVSGAVRSLLQTPTLGDCTGSVITGEYQRCFMVIGLDDRGPPAHKHWVHWSTDPSTQLGDGMLFAVEVNGTAGSDGQLMAPGWAGLGWSPGAPVNHPPQMINATAVFGYIDSSGNSKVAPYLLHKKGILDILEGPAAFGITNASVEVTADMHLVVRFRRAYDTLFKPGAVLRMITAHHHVFHGFIQHNHRAGLLFNMTGQGSMQVVPTRLKSTDVDAHAWCMFVAFGVLIPLGIMWARYCKGVMQKWYLVHLGTQCLGLAVALTGFLIAVIRFRPIPAGLAHFQLGVAVITITLLQPLNSIPRLTMHHTHVMRSKWWAYLHWMLGRVAVVFAWVNMFLGIARYRSWFSDLGDWAAITLACYLGAIVLVCLILEADLWSQGAEEHAIENDEINAKIAVLQERAQGSPYTDLGSADHKGQGDAEHPQPQLDHDDLLDQFAPPLPERTSRSFLLSTPSLRSSFQIREPESDVPYTNYSHTDNDTGTHTTGTATSTRSPGAGQSDLKYVSDFTYD
ncbi:hypothetical protein WJX73_004470 [Symbiochloris irregularis]|uniref:Cytochrome b561 domain-containing protein n=1 Tax=Symbiochloris irregularis TaxID=706552 RepID=A0AAW1P0J3_9CHLO